MKMQGIAAAWVKRGCSICIAAVYDCYLELWSIPVFVF